MSHREQMESKGSSDDKQFLPIHRLVDRLSSQAVAQVPESSAYVV